MNKFPSARNAGFKQAHTELILLGLATGISRCARSRSPPTYRYSAVPGNYARTKIILIRLLRHALGFRRQRRLRAGKHGGIGKHIQRRPLKLVSEPVSEGEIRAQLPCVLGIEARAIILAGRIEVVRPGCDGRSVRLPERRARAPSSAWPSTWSSSIRAPRSFFPETARRAP